MPETVLAAAPHRARKHLPGESGVWVLIFGDLMIFTFFFLAFLHARGQNIAVFAESRAQLNQAFGVFNTLLLLGSSWLVASALQAARKNLPRSASNLFAAAAVCGAGFVTIKVCEYREKLTASIGPDSNEFYNYYYLLTGIHLLHVLIGMLALAAMSRYVLSGTRESRIRYLECGACFWHLVDLLWIVLFALLYLVP